MCVFGECAQLLSHVPLFATPWTVAHQVPHSGIFQARLLEGLPFPTSGDHPNTEIKPASLAPPMLAGRFFTTTPGGGMEQIKEYFKF